MLKQIIAIIVLSIAVILTMSHVQVGLQWMITGHDWVSQQLAEVFSAGQAGILIRNLLALLAIPVLVGFIPALLYWLVKRSRFPYFMELVWVLWLVETAALVVQYKVVAAG